MTLATTHFPLQALCNYRTVPVVTPFGRWHHYVLFYPHREQGNECHWKATSPTRERGIPVMSYFATPYQKVTTLIPIALSPSMTAWQRPAVSSTEACQTPAH